MLDSAQKHAVTLPKVPTRVLLSAGTLVSFAWLLSTQRIHPVVLYVMQVYLTF